MKKKSVWIVVCFLCLLCSLLLFFSAGLAAEKIVDGRLDAIYAKEEKELYDLIYGQLEAQQAQNENALKMIDTLMEMEIPALRERIYETRQAKQQRLTDISNTKTVLQFVSGGLLLMGVGGLFWKGRTQKNE